MATGPFCGGLVLQTYVLPGRAGEKVKLPEADPKHRAFVADTWAFWKLLLSAMCTRSNAFGQALPEVAVSIRSRPPARISPGVGVYVAFTPLLVSVPAPPDQLVVAALLTAPTREIG